MAGRLYSKKIRCNWSEGRSIESAAKVSCTKCSWGIVWHQFGGVDKNKLLCEKCGAEVTFRAATPKEIFKFKPFREEEKSERKHYTADGVCKSLSLF